MFLIIFYVDYTVLETLDSLIQGVVVSLYVVHDYVNLRLLINLFPDLPNAISSMLDNILHFCIHLALDADNHDMRNAQCIK